MGTTADKLNAVLASKKAIKAAISEKTGSDVGDVISTYAEQIRNISGGGGGGIVSKPSKDVNFYDYDGTILYSYTIDEAKALTDLPAGPQHEGLVFDGWNYTLDEIKGEGEMCDVGAHYITDDGKTRYYITTPRDNFDIQLSFTNTDANGVTIEWGDGSTTTISSSGQQLPVHNYAIKGDYVIKVAVTSGTIDLGRANSSYTCMGQMGNIYRARVASLRKLEIGANVKKITAYCFNYVVNMETITMPRVMTEVATYAFCYAYSLRHLNIPRVANLGTYVCAYASSLNSVSIAGSIVSISNYGFTDCESLTRISFSNKITTLGAYILRNCKALTMVSLSPNIQTIDQYLMNGCYTVSDVKMPAALTSIKASSFAGCYCILAYDFTSCTVVPTLASTSVFNNNHSNSKFYVPAALYDEWCAASYWSSLKAKIVAV